MYIIVLCSPLGLLHASAKTKAGLDDVTDLKAALAVVAQTDSDSDTDDGYSTDEEYAKHQAVSNRFFARLSRKPAVREAVQQFKTELESNSPLTRITLDGLSSRSRVLLFRELTATVKGEEKTVPFSLNKNEFHIKLNPTLRQPGDGIVSGIGKHLEVYTILDAYKTSYQTRIAKNLLRARVQMASEKRRYHGKHQGVDIERFKDLLEKEINLDSKMCDILSHDGMTLNLEQLNVLLDFEVARRLQFTSDHDTAQRDSAGEYLDYIGEQGKEGESAGNPSDIAAAETQYARYNDFCKNITASKNRNTQRAEDQGSDSRKVQYMNSDRDKLDAVPVASAIVGALKLSADATQTELALQDFFHAPNKHSAGYSSGTYSAFEGVPDGGHRSSATKRIIRKYRGGTQAKPSTEAQIKQDYRDVFGGDSESEAEA